MLLGIEFVPARNVLDRHVELVGNPVKGVAGTDPITDLLDHLPAGPLGLIAAIGPDHQLLAGTENVARAHVVPGGQLLHADLVALRNFPPGVAVAHRVFGSAAALLGSLGHGARTT